MKYNLSDVCSRLSSGKNIKASEISSEGEYPVFGGNGQRGFTNHFNFDGECAIIGRQGAFCGNVRYFSGKAYMTEHAVVVCANDKSNIRYLAYLLSRMQLGRLSGQSAQPGLSVKVLAQQEIELPSIEYQNKIASILDSIEAKIFLNTAINDNLADIIQSVYQNRFSSTRSDVTAGVLADICSYSKDKVPVLDLNNSNYYSTENMQSDKKGAVDAATLPTIAQTTKCRKGDVLISNIRPYFKKIVYCQFDCGCSTDVLCFCPKESALSAFLFSTLYADHFFDFMAAGAKGTKMPRGDKQQIMTYPIYLPSADELAKFNSIAIPALTQMECSRLENTRLTALRDALLPKLMSGELDVSAIEL
ncbi:restriction endonuclease subunit S [Intestinimonas sp. MSJ-38]|uniref:restriction endonuclease subunit S n=1 Tax=Intestinimonas sp. MSJ-38 TaxID=2841532 RepID=UPI001C10EF97|nr:restriction endonuclease subunit S [Intestinimonas sp. MSJ-38]MBU5432305.1 restriction endonuclease subunit S [Intestinimonas sp. MSJ-38]